MPVAMYSPVVIQKPGLWNKTRLLMSKRGIETFYFGKNYDTAHKLFGKGTWGWANSGVGAEFDGLCLMFPRQGLREGIDGCGW